MYTESEGNILFAIIVVYFISLVVFAYLVNRRVKTFEDYSVASRSVGTFPMTLTLIATAIGGSILLGYMGDGYQYGAGYVWLAFLPLIPTMVLVLWMVKPIRKIGAKHNMTSIGDFTALIYGEKARIPTTISIIFAYCAVTGMQFVSISLVLSLTIDLDPTIGILIGWLLLTLKTVLGGLKAVVWQDAVQGTIQNVAIVILFIGALIVAGGWDTIVENVQASERPDALDIFNMPLDHFFALLLSIGAYQIVRQDIWQRVWAARSLRVIRISLWALIILQTVLVILIVYIGVIASFGLDVVVDDPEQVYYAVVNVVFPFPVAVIMVIAVLATVISTADSFFLAASGSIVSDVIKPRLTPEKAQNNLLFYSKVSVLITSVIALGLALYIPQLITLWSAGTAMLVSGLLTPVLAGLFWRRVTMAAGLTSMWAGLIVAATWQFMGEPLGWHPVFVGLPISIIAIVVVSVFTQPPQEQRPKHSLYTLSKSM